jgi:membrane-bound lytic murein transglycosylase MltF
MDYTQVGINIAISIGLSLFSIGLCYLAFRFFNKRIFPNIDFEKELREKNTSVAIVVAAIIIGIFSLSGKAMAVDLNQYDDSFKKYSRRYFSYMYDWRYFKAQGITESNLRSKVCSHVGACGVMQIMPGTARWIGLNPELRFNPKLSIQSGLLINYKYWSIFKKEKGKDRMDFMFAAYNAGPGSVIKAQKRARSSGRPENTWIGIRPSMPKETRDYVPKIRKWYSLITRR